MLRGKVLMVLTNHGKLGNTDKKTGWYLPEVAHPYHVFTEAGYGVDFMSPKGGKAPMDPGSGEQFASDSSCKRLLANKKVMAAIDQTKSPRHVNSSDYCCIFYAGGHGPMFDLPDATDVAEICAKIYQADGVVSAVCHGTAGLLKVKLPNGEWLIKGHKLTSFTNDEEEAVQLMGDMPFPLETKLKEHGAEFVGAENFTCNVVVSGRIVTGQNPASATETAQKIVEIMSK